MSSGHSCYLFCTKTSTLNVLSAAFTSVTNFDLFVVQIPTFGFLYVAGWIGYVGRLYLNAVRRQVAHSTNCCAGCSWYLLLCRGRSLWGYYQGGFAIAANLAAAVTWQGLQLMELWECIADSACFISKSIIDEQCWTGYGFLVAVHDASP